MTANIQFPLRLVYPDPELVPRPSPVNDDSMQRVNDETTKLIHDAQAKLEEMER